MSDSRPKIQIQHYQPQQHQHLIEELTGLLHKAYGPLAQQGMKYLASHQTTDITQERLLQGESFLVFVDDKLAGTVTLRKELPQSTCQYYRQPGVYSFGQFGISPELQGRGIGSVVMDFLEERALQLGASELALDTSEYARHLIEMYQKRGYRQVDETKWDVTNYRSVILSKALRNRIKSEEDVN